MELNCSVNEFRIYPQARKAFERMRQVAPSQMDGLEYYSTTLWHLKQEVSNAMNDDRAYAKLWVFSLLIRTQL